MHALLSCMQFVAFVIAATHAAVRVDRCGIGVCCRSVSVLSHAMSFAKEGRKSALVNSVDQMALNAYEPSAIQEFLPRNMDNEHAEYVASWLKDHHKKTLEPILKVCASSSKQSHMLVLIEWCCSLTTLLQGVSSFMQNPLTSSVFTQHMANACQDDSVLVLRIRQQASIFEATGQDSFYR